MSTIGFCCLVVVFEAILHCVCDPCAAVSLYQIEGFRRGIFKYCISIEIRAYEWESICFIYEPGR